MLYEIFTGKRAFTATSLADMRLQQESGSFTSLTDLVRDLDPAVERVVLRCLETDQVASRLVGVRGARGPARLATRWPTALAAGETPSPELVANPGRPQRTEYGRGVRRRGTGAGGRRAVVRAGRPRAAPFTQPASVLGPGH
ncbi:MAG: hypothetical protein IPO18_09430 [bacterium]|nr:hypothetical protein [bacterium]